MRLIDADALKDKISSKKLRVKNPNVMAGLVEMQTAALREIENAPTIELEVRSGEWTIARSYGEYDFWKCGNCKKWNDKSSKFCPRCGAKMKGC